MDVVEYLDEAGASPFRVWFDSLDTQSASRVARVLTRMSEGNLGDTKAVGAGVMENRIDFGAGYRLYLGRDGERLIVLLAGGTKRRQQKDIVAAQARWEDYKRRKKEQARDRADPKLQGDRDGARRTRARVPRRPPSRGHR